MCSDPPCGQCHLDKENHCHDCHCSHWLRKPHCTQHIHRQCNTTKLLSTLEFFLFEWHCPCGGQGISPYRCNPIGLCYTSPMIIGISQITLHLPGSHSLKEK